MSTKICKKCNKEKSFSEFHKSKKDKSGLFYTCKDCNATKSKAYWRTKEGVVVKIYRSQCRHSKRRGHLSPNYTKDEFRKWLFNQSDFQKLYDAWVETGYKTALKPSCDHTDDYQGYSLDRLRLMTWEEHNQKSYSDRKNGINNKMNKVVRQYDLEGNFIKEHYSTRQAERETGISSSSISNVCLEKQKIAGRFKWQYSN